ncbi:unnamed protein product [Urochloa humidicola]
MAAEETRLRFAIIAQVGNASRVFSAADVSRAVAEATDMDIELVPATPSFPESFLILCASQEARDRALRATPVPMATTFLSLRPWTRLIRASSRTLYHKVGIEMDGIPEHAWDLDTARKLLANHAWIERLDQATANKTDLSTFKLTAWTKDPFSFPASKTLCIAEPEPQITYADANMQRIFGNLEPYLRQKVILEYPVAIHLRTIMDFSSRTPSTSASSPSDNGDSGPDGNPDRSYGFRRGTGPRLHGFPRRQGNDGGGGGGGAAGAVNGGHLGFAHGLLFHAVGDQSKTVTSSKEARPQQHLPKAASDTDSATTAADKDPTTVATAVTATATAMGTEKVHASDGSPAATVDPAALAAVWTVVSECPVVKEVQDPMLIEFGCHGPTLLEKVNVRPPTPDSPMLDHNNQADQCRTASSPTTTAGAQVAAAWNPVAMQVEKTPELHQLGADVAQPAVQAATVATPPHYSVGSGPDRSRYARSALELGPCANQAGSDSEPSSLPGFSRAEIQGDPQLLAFTT